MALTLSRLTDDYVLALRHEMGRTKATVYTYRSWLNAYLKWLDARGLPDDLGSLSPTNLRAYQYALAGRGLRPRTVRSAFHPLKGLCAWLVAHGTLPENPCANITLPKKDAPIRAVVSSEEARLLTLGAERLNPPRRRALARAMIAALTMTGVRFQEWLALRVGDIDLATGELRVTSGKGQKARTLYPPPECLAAIGEWLTERGGMGCEHDYLWAYDRRRRVAELAARRLLADVKAAADLAAHDNIRPHALRHCFATRMLEHGASLKVIQTALGHSSLTTTAQYLHINEQEARKMSGYASFAPPNAETAPAPQGREAQARFLRRRRTGR